MGLNKQLPNMVGYHKGAKALKKIIKECNKINFR